MIINRYAISLLSREYKNDAVPEEVMIHKLTGEVLIKTTTGDVISFDSLARLKNHIDMATFNCYNLNVYGDMHHLILDSIELPEVVIEGINLLVNPIQVSTGHLNKLVVSVDLDSVELSSLDIPGEREPDIKLDFMFRRILDERNVSVTLPLSRSNTNVIRVEDFVPAGSMFSEYEVFLTGLTVMRDPQVSAADLRQILYSVLIIKE